MKLRKYLEYEGNVTVYREVPVGRDLTIGGRPALIVALREVGITENDEPERPDCGDMSPGYKQNSCTQDGALKRIVQMHVLSVYRDCCSSEGDYEEAEMTNRDVFMEQIEEDHNEQNTAVCGFTVNGEVFEICEDHIDWGLSQPASQSAVLRSAQPCSDNESPPETHSLSGSSPIPSFKKEKQRLFYAVFYLAEDMGLETDCIQFQQVANRFKTLKFQHFMFHDISLRFTVFHYFYGKIYGKSSRI